MLSILCMDEYNRASLLAQLYQSSTRIWARIVVLGSSFTFVKMVTLLTLAQSDQLLSCTYMHIQTAYVQTLHSMGCHMESDCFSNGHLKGTVRRDARWVENRLKRCILTNYMTVSLPFLFLKRHHHEKNIKPASAS